MSGPTILNVQVAMHAPSLAAPAAEGKGKGKAKKVLGKRAKREEEDVAIPSALTGMDLSRPLPYPPSEDVVEAMRQRILQLETELYAMKRQKTAQAPPPPPVAAPSKTANAVAGPSTAPAQTESTTASASKDDPKADEKVLKVRRKGIFDSLKKSCRAEKWWGKTRKVKWEEHYSMHDFGVVFRGGYLQQPLPDNKPKSPVYIVAYEGDDLYKVLLGDMWKPEQLVGWRYAPRGTINMVPGTRIKEADLELLFLEVHWNKHSEKATFIAEVSEEDLSPYWIY